MPTIRLSAIITFNTSATHQFIPINWVHPRVTITYQGGRQMSSTASSSTTVLPPIIITLNAHRLPAIIIINSQFAHQCPPSSLRQQHQHHRHQWALAGRHRHAVHHNNITPAISRHRQRRLPRHCNSSAARH